MCFKLRQVLIALKLIEEAKNEIFVYLTGSAAADKMHNRRRRSHTIQLFRATRKKKSGNEPRLVKSSPFDEFKVRYDS